MKIIKTIKTILISTFAMLLFTSAAHAEISVMGVRVGAVDVAALAEYYKSAFGLKEVNRLDLAEGQLEIMLNFGDTIDEALENSRAQVVIMHRETDDIEDAIPHLILSVSDIDATAAAVIEAGGKITLGPFSYGDTGIKIAFTQDPVGNLVELLQTP